MVINIGRYHIQIRFKNIMAYNNQQKELSRLKEINEILDTITFKK